MATKLTTLRLKNDTREQLAYLAKLTGQSPVEVMTDLVSETVNWILEWAAQANHNFEDTPDLLYRGGTILSDEEQQAVHQLRMLTSSVGADLWAHRHDR